MSTMPADVAPLITYRQAPSGRLQAAYLGTVRVGYVEQRATGRWMWQLSLIRPQGGIPLAIDDDEESAKLELAKALAFWIDSAGLRLSTANQEGSPL